MNAGNVSTNITGSIATITFSHPSHNTLPSAVLIRLASVIRQVGNNPSVNVIILRSGGNDTFCAGANFDELLGIQDEEAGRKFFSGFAHVINAIRKATKIVIGRIQGKALGGAVGLVAACDYSFASAEAAIKLSELSLGFGPFVNAPVIMRKTSLSAFTELALQSTSFKSATWAHENGLYQSVYGSIEELDQAIYTFATNLSSYHPDALTAIKTTLWQNTDDWDTLLLTQAEMSGKMVLSEHTKSMLRAFKDRK